MESSCLISRLTESDLEAGDLLYRLAFRAAEGRLAEPRRLHKAGATARRSG